MFRDDAHEFLHPSSVQLQRVLAPSTAEQLRETNKVY